MWRASPRVRSRSSTCQSSRRPAAGWKKPRRARAVRAVTAPYAATVPGSRSDPIRPAWPGEPVVGAEEVGRPRLRVVHDAMAGAAVVDGEGRAEGQHRVRGDSPQRGRLLELDVGRGLRLVGELDHQLPAVVAEEDDLVALAVQGGEDAPADAVRRTDESGDRLVGEPWGRARQHRLTQAGSSAARSPATQSPAWIAATTGRCRSATTAYPARIVNILHFPLFAQLEELSCLTRISTRSTDSWPRGRGATTAVTLGGVGDADYPGSSS